MLRALDAKYLRSMVVLIVNLVEQVHHRENFWREPSEHAQPSKVASFQE